ncbi:MAG: hypothetical protein UEL26_06940, partial [Segatella copri]|nr:hypothetical protein [Segatella copri]
LQIPRTQKRLGHFLTTDCKSVETPNGIDAKSSARRPEKSLPQGVQKSLPQDIQRKVFRKASRRI